MQLRPALRSLRALAAVLAVLAVPLTAAAVLSLGGAHAQEPDPVAVAEARMVAGINGLRAEQGLAQLPVDVDLAGVARRWSQRMGAAGSLSHNPDRAGEYPHPAEDVSEVVGQVRQPGMTAEWLADRVVAAWRDSSGHRAVILGGSWDALGAGAFLAGDGTLWATVNTVDLPAGAQPAGAPPPAPAPPERPPAPAAAPAPDVAGPVATALGVSRSLLGDGAAERVVLARADLPADALGGAPLLGPAAPILLVPPPSAADLDPALPGEVAAEVRRILAPGGSVLILGGTAAVSQAAAGQLAGEGFSVNRLAGADRAETSVLAAREALEHRGEPRTIVLARADAWADALAGGAWAAASGAPLLVTPGDALHPAVAAFIAELPEVPVSALGGPAALSDAVVAAAGATRVAGDDRAATAAAVTRELWRRDAGHAGDTYVVVPGWTATGWADALAYAPISSLHAAPQLPVDAAVPAAVSELLAGLGHGSAVPARFVGTPGTDPVALAALADAFG